ncbi:MAG: hypothetical protein WD739_06985 [Actinomycetota bacterium]
MEHTSAFVREGSKLPGATIWAKERYDWSVPGTVRWTVEESNFCEPGSYMAATVRPAGVGGEPGGSRVHIEWERTGTGVRGKILVRMIKLSNGKPLARSLQKAFRRSQESGG